MTCAGLSLAVLLMPTWIGSWGNNQRACQSLWDPSTNHVANLLKHQPWSEVGSSVPCKKVSPVFVTLLYFFGSGWGVSDACMKGSHLPHPFQGHYPCSVTAELQKDKEHCCVARSRMNLLFILCDGAQLPHILPRLFQLVIQYLKQSTSPTREATA